MNKFEMNKQYGGMSVGGHGYNNNTSAILYLYTPQLIPDMNIRPSQYQFDMNFVSAAEKFVDEANTESISSLSGHFTPIQNSQLQALDHAIKPSMNAIHFQSQLLGDRNWTFMLIVDNAPMLGRTEPARLNNRVIYVGFVLGDEPAIQSMGRTILNPNCTMIVTKRTYMQVRNVATSTGYSTSAMVNLDEDVIVPNTVVHLNPDRGYLLTPHSLATSFAYDGFGQEYDAAGIAYIGNTTSNLRLDTRTVNPRAQIESIINGITKMKLFGTTDELVSSRFRSDSSLVHSPERDRQAFIDELNTGAPNIDVGLPLNAPLQMSTIMSMYPVLEHTAQIISIPYSVPGNMFDTQAPTPTNIWTSMVQATIPSVLSYYGICELSMRYCSYNPVAVTILDNQPLVEVMDIGTYMPMSTDQLKARWDYAYIKIMREIFNVIQSNCGNFDVTISYNANNYCAVQLQLLDMMEVPLNDYAITHGTMTPLANPLIGTVDNRYNNATQLNDLVTYVANSAQIPGALNF